MKKSFKKAGAAVLSMAMIMAMGAISMPVYAATPGSVTVSIPGAFKQGEGDSQRVDQVLYDANPDATLKYQYLDLAGVTEAKVNMYKVASLGGDGWKWEEPFRGATNDHPNSVEGFSNWEALLQTLGDTGVTGENAGNFTYSSTELQKLASYLERVVRNLEATVANGSTASAADKAAAQAALTTISKGSGTLSTTIKTVTIPAPAIGTKNEIGYYLLMTETDESGVIIQPVLVSLKNDKHINASLKGTKIKIDKSIEAVETTDGEVVDDTTTVAATGDSAVVAKSDRVKYQIKAQLPTYDVNVESGNITTFQIVDTADPGIKLDTANLKVYLSEDGELDTTADYLLTSGTSNDYSLTDTGDNKFTVNISGAQLLGETTSSTLKTIMDNSEPPKQKYKNMEGMYVFVVVEATVNDKWTVDSVNAAKEAYKAKYEEEHPGDSTDAVNAAVDAYLAAEGIVAGKYKFDRTYTDHVTVQTVTQEMFNNANISEALSDINLGKYSAAELDEANFAGVTIVDVHDVMIPKTKVVDGVEVPVYLNDRNEETTKESEAKKENGVAVRATMVDPEHNNLVNRVRLLIARDNANAKNGNVNKAQMKYGNVYSTGGGYADDEDSTKLFSVDLNLDKFTDKLMLTSGVSEVSDAAGVKAWLALDGTPSANDIVAALKAKAETVATVPAASDYTDALVTAVNDAATGAESSLTDDEAKKVASLIKAYNDSIDTDANGENYLSDIEKTPVQNAVFKLSKVNADTTKTLIGYAASDANGDLKVVGEANAEMYNAYKSGNITNTDDSNKIIIKVDDNTYYWYAPDSEDAWIMLTEGTYEIEEVYAPAGYKKYNGAATFTISCARDTISADYTGKFSGESNSDLFRPVSERDTTDVKPTVEFEFVGPKGELQQDMYNALADTLPATGGMGTVLFTAGGIAVILMAGALFVVYMKKRNAEEEE